MQASEPALKLPECTEVRQAKKLAADPKAALLFSFLLLCLVAAPAQAAGDLVLFPDPLWLVILIVAFALLVAPMNALLFKPVFRVLDEREARIQGARRRAGQLQGEADEILRRYRDSVREVREEMEQHRRSQLEAAREESGAQAGAAREEAERIVERSRADLGVWLTSAKADLRSSVEPLARIAAERVLGREFE